jgi:ferrous iron transport protein B
MELTAQKNREAILSTANNLRWDVGENFHDTLMESIYSNASAISKRSVTLPAEKETVSWEKTLDKVLTSRYLGFPIMFLILGVVFWLTIEGANVPSALIASFLLDTIHPLLKSLSAIVGLPFWADGVLIDGAYMAMAWVISVMLPPMAIFFPLFTFLEDFGYLPRVSFNKH